MKEEKDLGGTGLTVGDGVSVSVPTPELPHDVRVLSLRELLRVQEAYASTSPMKNRGVSAVRAQALRDAIAMVENSAQAWQPIETAPKDGTAIVVLTARGSVVKVSAQDGVADDGWVWVACNEDEHPRDWDDGVCWSINADGEESDPPTHWMPLPAPPKEVA